MAKTSMTQLSTKLRRKPHRAQCAAPSPPSPIKKDSLQSAGDLIPPPPTHTFLEAPGGTFPALPPLPRTLDSPEREESENTRDLSSLPIQGNSYVPDQNKRGGGSRGSRPKDTNEYVKTHSFADRGRWEVVERSGPTWMGPTHCLPALTHLLGFWLSGQWSQHSGKPS